MSNIKSGPWQGRTNERTSFASGGEPPYDDGMDSRVAKLEEFVVEARERLTSIETRLEQTASKTDAYELRGNIKDLDAKLSADVRALGVTQTTNNTILAANISSDIKDIAAKFGSAIELANSKLGNELVKAKADVESQINSVKWEAKSYTESAASTFKIDVQKNTTDITRWMIITVVGLFIGFAGLFFTMSNFLKPSASASTANHAPATAASAQAAPSAPTPP
ncbi:hypothetical protein FHI69_03110 [Janthinobacterium lividum]|uniref:Uncharacterized protein n=1 Tax=Janthinobacterium lividum TaxID=29581 RepID=A0A5C4NYL7_9BURK|nr:hypothetical protein [Janthinobacterium lividum]TNC78296.1 hypothetical protein FHI69_03110 [Janthinobacterium lividum]